MMLIDILSWFCLVAGSLVIVTTGVGLLRLPTFYTRVHAASVTDTMGAGLILLGLALRSNWMAPWITVKLFVVLAFLVFTGPPAAHAMAKGAYLHGLTPKLPEDWEAGESEGAEGDEPSNP